MKRIGRSVKRYCSRAIRTLANAILWGNILLILGLATISAGAGMAWPPLGAIVAGVAMLLIGFSVQAHLLEDIGDE